MSHRRALSATVLLVLLVLLLAPRARAFRPCDFSDADVAASRTLEIEMAPAEFVDRAAQHSLRAPSLTLTFGLGRGLELGVEGVHSVFIRTAGEEPPPAIFESAVALKALLRRGCLQEKPGPSIAVEGEVAFPSRGETHLGASGSGFVSIGSKAGDVHLGLQAERSPEGEDAVGAGLILESADLSGWRPVLELETAGSRGAAPERGLLAGLVYEPHDGLAFDAGVDLGQGDEGHWTELRGGVTWQLGPRATEPVRRWVKHHLRRNPF